MNLSTCHYCLAGQLFGSPPFFPLSFEYQPGQDLLDGLLAVLALVLVAGEELLEPVAEVEVALDVREEQVRHQKDLRRAEHQVDGKEVVGVRGPVVDPGR